MPRFDLKKEDISVLVIIFPIFYFEINCDYFRQD